MLLPTLTLSGVFTDELSDKRAIGPLYLVLEFGTVVAMRPLMRLWFHLLLLVTPFVFTAINDELFEFNKMLAVYVATIAVTATWAVWSLRAKKLIWRSHPLLPFMGLFLLSQILSTVFSMHFPTSIFGYYSRFHGGLLSTISYLLLAQVAISTLEKSDIRPLVRSALWSMTAVCLYAIPEHFGFSPSCLLITGEANVACWVQDVQNRVFATFGQPNWLAAYLLVMIPLAIWYFLTSEVGQAISKRKNENLAWSGLLQWWPAGSLFLALLTLIFTKSRSGELGLIVGLSVFGVALALGWWRQRKEVGQFFRQKTRAIGGVIAALLLPALIFGFMWWPGLESQLLGTATRATSLTAPSQGTQLENGGTDSGRIRWIVWQGALKVWQRYPVLGSGVETFAYSYYQDRLREHNDISEWDFLYNKAHNEFLNFLATTGALGLASYVGLLAASSWIIFKTGLWDKSANNELRLAAAAWLAAIAGLSVSNFFGFSTVMVSVLLFLLPAWWLVMQRKDQEKSHSASSVQAWEELDWFGWSAVAMISLLALWSIIQVSLMWRNDHLLAVSKASLAAGQSQEAYTSVLRLTERAPGEALFWEQRALTMAQLAVGTLSQDASTAAVLAQDAELSTQNMLRLNPVHLNLWKSRVRVLLYLSTVDESYLDQAVDSLHRARQLSPTDSKLTYNLALVHETLEQVDEADQWYRATLELRPGYEAARNSYAQMLETAGKPEAALEQYRYILTELNPSAPEALDRVASLEAQLEQPTPSK